MIRTLQHDVAVIGGGIVGLSAALHLQARGLSVAIIDPGEPRARASFGNAGVISRGSILPVASAAVRRSLPVMLINKIPGLRVRHGTILKRPMWFVRFLTRCNDTSWRRAAHALNPLVAIAFDEHLALAARVGAHDVIERRGWLKLYRSAIDFDASLSERRILAEAGVRTTILENDELRALEPALSPRFRKALWFPDTGSVREPQAVVARYEEAFRRHGGTEIRAMARAVERNGERRQVLFDGGALDASHVVVAAGAHSDSIACAAGASVPLIAERGYHGRFAAGAGATLTRPVFDVAGGYVLAPSDEGVRVFSGVEIALPDDRFDRRQFDTAVADARSTVALGEQTDPMVWMGSRPSTPDSLPVIGRSPRDSHTVLAYGHGHIGFSTGPATGRIVADLITGRAPPIDISPFSAARFASRSAPSFPEETESP